jgi:TPR repeat protein
MRVGASEAHNVKASSCYDKATLLLGLSFFKKQGAMLDLNRNILILKTEDNLPPEVLFSQPPACDVAIEKFVNAASIREAKNNWTCTAMVGTNSTAPFVKFAVQVFGDGTGYDSAGEFKWKKTGCDSIELYSGKTGKPIGIMEDISGDSKYGVVTSVVRYQQYSTIPLHMMCVLKDGNLRAPTEPRAIVVSPSAISPFCTFLKKTEIDNDVVLIEKIGAEQGATHVALERTTEKNKAMVSMYNCPAVNAELAKQCQAGKSEACVEIIEKAAQQGNANAQVLLGRRYVSGEGVPVDLKRAFEWLTKAANQGNASGQADLGIMYYVGKGVSQDLNRALSLFTKGAEQGNAMARYGLGLMYYTGNGVPKDVRKAIELVQKAAKQGNSLAQASLGNFYYTGEGVQRNLIESYMWFKLAAAQNVVDANRMLGELERQMTQKQMSTAETRASQFVPHDDNADAGR